MLGELIPCHLMLFQYHMDFFLRVDKPDIVMYWINCAFYNLYFIIIYKHNWMCYCENICAFVKCSSDY